MKPKKPDGPPKTVGEAPDGMSVRTEDYTGAPISVRITGQLSGWTLVRFLDAAGEQDESRSPFMLHPSAPVVAILRYPATHGGPAGEVDPVRGDS